MNVKNMLDGFYESHRYGRLGDSGVKGKIFTVESYSNNKDTLTGYIL